MGIRTVVNLRSSHSDRDKLQGLGLSYAHIPSTAAHPEDEDIVRFLAIATDPKNQPVFVHCQHGSDRTGLMVAAYRVAVQRWRPEDAAEELPRFGFHPVWTSIRSRILSLDGEKLRESVARLPRASLEIVP